jgi:CO dehydrogenase maturation factor
MKIAVAGKGGTGKTTICTLLARVLEAGGRDVIAVDADSNSNFAYALGVPSPETIIPLTEMEDLIQEKTGAQKGRYGAYFRMNPDVSDIPERFMRRSGKVNLLVMGTVDKAGGGCACPEYVLIKALVSHLLLNRNEDMVIDMEAGLEHLGRGVTEKVDALLAVAQPGKASAVTAVRVAKLARDLKIRAVYGVGNAIRSEEEAAYLRREAPGIEFIAFLPFSREVAEYEREGKNIFGIAELREQVGQMAARIQKQSKEPVP